MIAQSAYIKASDFVRKLYSIITGLCLTISQESPPIWLLTSVTGGRCRICNSPTKSCFNNFFKLHYEGRFLYAITITMVLILENYFMILRIQEANVDWLIN